MYSRTVKESGKSSSALAIDVTTPAVARLCVVLALTNQYFSDLLLNLRMHRFDTI